MRLGPRSVWVRASISPSRTAATGVENRSKFHLYTTTSAAKKIYSLFLLFFLSLPDHCTSIRYIQLHADKYNYRQ